MSFAKNARVMVIGYAIAQALPLLASPLLARLFSPAAFGLQTLFMSTSSLLLVVATLRLDLAAVLAFNKEEALDIASLAIAQTGLVTLLIAITTLLGPWVAPTVFVPWKDWLWAAAPMVASLAIVQVAIGQLTWQNRFGATSFAQIANQSVYLSTALILAYTASGPMGGLVVAKLMGQVLAAMILSAVLFRTIIRLRIPRRTTIQSLWAKCKPFVLFNTPYSLVGVFGREVPVFAFASVSASAAMGFYGLARTLLWAPASLLAASLSQVFFREATVHRGTERVFSLAQTMFSISMLSSAPIFALVLVWGDVAFAQAFGDEWRSAGIFAMVLAIPGWLSIQTAWPERLYESVGRQDLSFRIQIAADAISAIVVFSAVIAGFTPLHTIVAFAVVNSLFHLTYLSGMFHVAGFGWARLLSLLRKGAAVFTASAAVSALVRLFVDALLWGVLASGVAMGSLALYMVLRAYRSFARIANS